MTTFVASGAMKVAFGTDGPYRTDDVVGRANYVAVVFHRLAHQTEERSDPLTEVLGIRWEPRS